MEAYALEVDRRCKLMFGKSATDAYGLGQLSGKNLAKMRAGWWGQPRQVWAALQLGPLNAWVWGAIGKKNK